MIGILNAHMFGHPTEPGEYIDWSRPDILSEEAFVLLVGMTLGEYAEQNPHMIVFEVES